MKEASTSLDFEKAALLRDQIQALNRVLEGQRIAATVKSEQDVIAFAQDNNQAYVQVFFIRSGKLLGRESFILQGTRSEEPSQIMSSFIKQFYASAPYVPSLLLLQHPIADKAIIEDWLQSKRETKVRIQVPHRGNKRQLLKIVAKNAQQGLEQLKIKQIAAPKALAAALAEIKEVLELHRLPNRIEGYDISNIQGKTAVGSMVIFEQGKSRPSHYRRFRIKTVAGADDYAMLREVLKRRFRRISGASSSDIWAVLPDLVLVDGGKGQLNTAREVMRETGAESVPVASLAKENEELFVPRKKQPIVLPRSSLGLQLLQRLRDEAHRFAITYHRRLRKREAFTSALDTIPGIGPKRKRTLLKQLGSVQSIRTASEEELATTKGMSRSLARRIKEHL
jgi:excinuclease ABC subunit C